MDSPELLSYAVVLVRDIYQFVKAPNDTANRQCQAHLFPSPPVICNVFTNLLKVGSLKSSFGQVYQKDTG